MANGRYSIITDIFKLPEMDFLFDSEKCDGVKQSISGLDEVNCPGCEGQFWCGKVKKINS